ncbi:MAG: GNAT family N-acetyltransferase [Gemmatimonadota bacterium]|nr:MAG: GNAT family N-acetyltransferase [Gemmatimonadota bacterium]
MSLRYRFLDTNAFPAVYRTFVRAFSDYALDMSYMAEGSLYSRAVKNGVDFESSVGAYYDQQMVGFTLIGVDHFRGALSAFDIGTGVIADYRGRGVASEMLDFALPRLKEGGVRKFVLEVLQDNERAVRAYRKTGFEVVRELDCFELSLESFNHRRDGEAVARARVRSVGRDHLALFQDALDWQPSWENSFASIRRIPDEVRLYEADFAGQPAGLLAYYPLLNWIMTVVVRRPYRRQGVGSLLVGHLVERIKDRESSVKLLNVQRDDDGMQTFLTGLGFHRYVSQFEMESLL